jgi:hypothetical protein
MKIEYEDLKKHMIVHLKINNVNVIVFYLTAQEIKKKRINADEEGFYGFRGLWYKGNGTRYSSYGKIYNLSYYKKDMELVRTGIHGLSKKELRHIVR